MGERKAIDNLYLYDPQFEPAAKKFVDEDTTKNAAEPITSADDIKKAATGYSGIKLLIFDTHGAPGHISLSNGDKVEAISFSFLAPDPTFLGSNARILFLGCNIGEGTDGDKFIDGIAKQLLTGKGGTVGATTAGTIVFNFPFHTTETYLMPLSFGRLKVKRYDVMGKELASQTVDRRGIQRPLDLFGLKIP
jgi:hypothetical protein